jgi:glycosyltransferase-like protein
MSAPLRIAMLTYSVKPRGGVVHSIAVAEALARRGNAVELFAVGRPGERFFREPAVPATVVEHTPPDAPFDDRVAAMIQAYSAGLAEAIGGAGFDVVHAQDCISANAALALRDAGAIPHVLRTVHHVDEFVSPSLIACQDRSITAPDAVVCVSDPWARQLADRFGVQAQVVGNGVDTTRYRPPRDARERAADRAALGFGDRPVVLAVGGIEPRKGSLTLLDGLAYLRAELDGPEPLLVVAGGATLFDYRDELDRWARRRAEIGLTGDSVRELGPVGDAELERLYRAADVLAFPSVAEGFGLVVLEALASGLPVVASDIEVLRGFLDDGDSALLFHCGDPASLGHALALVLRDQEVRERIVAGGEAVAALHTWDAVAVRHDRTYSDLLAARLPLAR